jgi:hypothetical protein
MSEPAFPSTNAIATASGVMTQGHPGMTLRDYFATHADIGNVDGLPLSWGERLLGRKCPECNPAAPRPCLQWWADYRAAMRYMEADAMLKAREEPK